jgi:hypothetical protein
VELTKARFDDRVITTREVQLTDGRTMPAGTHGFVIEVTETPEAYDVEFDLADGQVLATVQPEDFGAA